jgi:hypothetical protein
MKYKLKIQLHRDLAVRSWFKMDADRHRIILRYRPIAYQVLREFEMQIGLY